MVRCEHRLPGQRGARGWTIAGGPAGPAGQWTGSSSKSVLLVGKWSVPTYRSTREEPTVGFDPRTVQSLTARAYGMISDSPLEDGLF